MNRDEGAEGQVHVDSRDGRRFGLAEGRVERRLQTLKLELSDSRWYRSGLPAPCTPCNSEPSTIAWAGEGRLKFNFVAV